MLIVFKLSDKFPLSNSQISSPVSNIGSLHTLYYFPGFFQNLGSLQWTGQGWVVEGCVSAFWYSF